MGETVNCQQRKLRMLFNVPMPRFTPISPYETNPTLTQFDLDMRRKAEVLKHTGSQKSTQVNKLTKAQSFAQAIRGFSPTQKLLNKNTGEYNSYCDSSMNARPTSSSDVPGPVMSLYLDKNIPLYNYASPKNPLSEMVVYENELRFQFLVNPDATTFVNGVSQNIGTLVIYETIHYVTSVFTMTIPYHATTSSPTTPLHLLVTFSGSPILAQSYIVCEVDTLNRQLIFRNILLNTSTGYVYEFALTTSSLVTLNPATITITK